VDGGYSDLAKQVQFHGFGCDFGHPLLLLVFTDATTIDWIRTAGATAWTTGGNWLGGAD
jgi:hypothetical protein